MKKSVLVAATLLVSAVVIAAPVKKATKPAKKAKAVAGQAKKSATTKVANRSIKARNGYLLASNTTSAASATASSSATAPAASNGAATQSTTTIQQANAEVEKSKFGLLLLNRVDVSSADVNRGEGEAGPMGGYTLMRGSYQISPVVSVAIGQEFVHSYGVTAFESGNKRYWALQDTYFQVAHSNLGMLPGQIKAKAAARLYVPTSEASQDIGQIALARVNGNFSKKLGRVGLGYSWSPRAYFQQYRTFLNKGSEAGTRAYRYVHSLDGSVDLGAGFSASTSFGLDHSWFHGDPELDVDPKYTEKLVTESRLDYGIGVFNIGAGIGQTDPDLLRQKRGEGDPLYNERYTNYFVEGTLAF